MVPKINHRPQHAHIAHNTEKQKAHKNKTTVLSQGQLVAVASDLLFFWDAKETAEQRQCDTRLHT